MSASSTTRLQDFVQFGVAIVAGQTMYVGDMDLILGEDSLYRLAEKPLLMRWARRFGQAAQGAGGEQA